MFFSCFRARKLEQNNLSQLFDQHCSLGFHKKRSAETHKLAAIIKENSVLNYNDASKNLNKLSLEQLASDADKITNIFNAIDAWYDKRMKVSERIDKVLEFRRIIKPYLRDILLRYQEIGNGRVKKEWCAGETTPRIAYKPYVALVLTLPFASQIFDALPDLIGLFN